MNVTAESSMPLTNALARSVPSTYLRQVNDLFDELQALRKLHPDAAAKHRAMVERANHANATKNSRIHAAIDTAIEQHRLQLPDAGDSTTARAKWLADRIKEGVALAESGGEVPDAYKAITRAPSWRGIYSRLKEMEF